MASVFGVGRFDRRERSSLFLLLGKLRSLTHAGAPQTQFLNRPARRTRRAGDPEDTWPKDLARTTMLSSTHIDPENLLRHAITHHQAGRLPDAERFYRLVLTHQPEQPDAHHNLGVLAMQSGRVEDGLPHLKEALDIDPANGQYWLSYARGLLCAGQIEAAHATLQTAIGHGLQGESARVLQQQIAVARANAPANAPTSPPTGGTDPVAPLFALLRAGRHTEMETAARTLLRQHPNHGKIWRLLGTALSRHGAIDAGSRSRSDGGA